MRGGRRLLLERHGDHTLDRRRVQRRLAARTRGVAFETRRAAGKIAITPAIGGPLGLAGGPNDRRHSGALRPKQNDPCAPNQLLRRVAARNPAFQPRLILGR